MKTKNYLIAIALFGGMLFTVCAANTLNLDGTTTAKVDKTKIKVPQNG
ncbi:hypothetical protein ACFSKN_02380 [Mariniflexile gromovii]|uniref:Uncharacterized protein n=1 Tax=Mariniflexile gromovii TaxID=362523 RepID=A0ABS4BPE0_9FLAO|nr:hypothetical protein [Mariniflexile gromovii]MBP0902450.1 hypothetical protein [Mariniflexile gromovii]